MTPFWYLPYCWGHFPRPSVTVVRHLCRLRRLSILVFYKGLDWASVSFFSGTPIIPFYWLYQKFQCTASSNAGSTCPCVFEPQSARKLHGSNQNAGTRTPEIQANKATSRCPSSEGRVQWSKSTEPFVVLQWGWGYSYNMLGLWTDFGEGVASMFWQSYLIFDLFWKSYLGRICCPGSPLPTSSYINPNASCLYLPCLGNVVCEHKVLSTLLL